MAINVNYHRGTRLKTMEKVLYLQSMSHLNVLTFSPLNGGCSEGLGAFNFLFKQLLPPSGNPFKYHVDALSLQPIKQYIITNMSDVVLIFFCFVFAFCLVSLHGD